MIVFLSSSVEEQLTRVWIFFNRCFAIFLAKVLLVVNFYSYPSNRLFTSFYSFFCRTNIGRRVHIFFNDFTSLYQSDKFMLRSPFFSTQNSLIFYFSWSFPDQSYGWVNGQEPFSDTIVHCRRWWNFLWQFLSLATNISHTFLPTLNYFLSDLIKMATTTEETLSSRTGVSSDAEKVPGKKIKIQSNDGQVYEIEEDVIDQSSTIKTLSDCMLSVIIQTFS